MLNKQDFITLLIIEKLKNYDQLSEEQSIHLSLVKGNFLKYVILSWINSLYIDVLVV